MTYDSAEEVGHRKQTDDEKLQAEQIRTLVFDLIRRGQSQRELANEIGMPQSVLSKWLQVTWQTNWMRQLDRLALWQQHRLQGQTLAPNEPVWVETPTGRGIRDALAFAQLEPTISMVYGASGVGKTTAIQRYASEGRNVWTVTVSPTKTALEAALRAVAEAVGLRGLVGGADQLSRDITARLYGSRGLLIVDEAQSLSDLALEELRSIHDACGVGICLSGNEKTYTRMTGGHRAVAFAQLGSRLGLRLQLLAVQREDVDALVDAWAIKGHEERQFLRVIGEGEGLHILTKVLRNASRTADAAGTQVGIQQIRAASRGVGLRL